MPKNTAKTKDEGAHFEIKLKFYSYDLKLLDTTLRNVIEAIKRSGASVKGPIMLPTRIKRWTVNRSPFIYKTSQEHFELRIHQRLLVIVNPNPQTIEYMRDLQVPAGVQVIVKNK